MHQQKHMYWTHISIHSAMKTLAQKSHLKEKSTKVLCYNYKKPLLFIGPYQSHLIPTKARHEFIVTDKTCEGTILIRLQYHIFFYNKHNRYKQLYDETSFFVQTDLPNIFAIRRLHALCALLQVVHPRMGGRLQGFEASIKHSS